MKYLLIPFLIGLNSSMAPILSHGFTENCSEKCNDYYCPSEDQPDKKEKVKNNIPSKKWIPYYFYSLITKKEETEYEKPKLLKIWNFLIYGISFAIGSFLVYLYSF